MFETSHSPQLADILCTPDAACSTQELRWRVAVPMISNPFLLMDVFWFSLLGAALVLVILLCGVWFTEGNLSPGDIYASLEFTGLVFLGCVTSYILLSVIFFKNRYFAMYNLCHKGIYHEAMRGKDQRPFSPCPHIRPYPVAGNIHAVRTKSKFLSWGQADHFQNIPSMRVLHIKRGWWHVLRLYTPDPTTHELAVTFMTQHLAQGRHP